MNSNTILTDSFKNSELFNINLKINKLRNLIDDHIISIDSHYGNIIDDIDEKTTDNIIDDVINSISENNQTDNSQTEQMSETTDKYFTIFRYRNRINTNYK